MINTQEDQKGQTEKQNKVNDGMVEGIGWGRKGEEEGKGMSNKGIPGDKDRLYRRSDCRNHVQELRQRRLLV